MKLNVQNFVYLFVGAGIMAVGLIGFLNREKTPQHSCELAARCALTADINSPDYIGCVRTAFGEK